MGIYVNPAIQAFEEAVNSDIYVDKTEMILDINRVVGTKQKYISVSRPRRFGKTMAADMICAYYGRNNKARGVFKERKLAEKSPSDWDSQLGRYDVIRVVMTDFIKKDVPVEASLSIMKHRILDELSELYSKISPDDSDLSYNLERAYLVTNRQFVVVIDEWDAIFRIRKDDGEGQLFYLDFLRDLFKDRTYIALAYMTGILPIKKYGEHSALNMFDEYSMISPLQLAKYTGFTLEEVKKLCEEYNMDLTSIIEWYDGYKVADSIPLEKRNLYRLGNYDDHILQIFSPLSVVKAMRTGVTDNYWNNTETYEALAEYIKRNFDGLKEDIALLMDGARMKVNFSKYQNDMTSFQSKDDILTLLIHLGYLSYDAESEEVFIPNKEVLDVFKDSTSDEEWHDTFDAYDKSVKLVEATWNCDEDEIASALEHAHDKADNKTYYDEKALSYAVRYAYYAAQKYYSVLKELDSGKGYADLVFIPSPKYAQKPLIIIELKNCKSPEEALQQIINRNYMAEFDHYKGNIIAIGINYDGELNNTQENYKRHSCKIKKF
ncbi:AAA family ATPase [Butyrivibrio proteoclasticus]|uniref:AAA family ATPase n=1 Tax=Butyrivibrio proteoclasticus TaxID=43305 RepID=UPI00047D4247|nr:AAA family ATPase [Butyrivibrio proteoclasticus]